MGYVGRFERGTKIIEIDGTGIFSLMPDFIPPSTVLEFDYAGGTGINDQFGSSLSGVKAVNRSFTFTFKAESTTNPNIELQTEELRHFLHGAGDPFEPTYFAWKPDTLLGFEPIAGQLGAYKRVEVVACDAFDYWDLYAVSTLREQAIQITVTITIKPGAEGLTNAAGFAVGGVIEDWIGLGLRKSRGTMVAEGTTNKIGNCVFDNATSPGLNWVTGASLTVTVQTKLEFKLWGKTPIKVEARAGTDSQRLYNTTVAAGNTNQHTYTAYVIREDGGDPSSDCSLYYNTATVSTSFTAVPGSNGWYRAEADIPTAQSGSVNIGIVVVAGSTLYIDGFQFEEKAYSTPMCYGDLHGCSWSGSAHASSSTRVAGQLYLPVTQEGIQIFGITEGTVILVWQTPYAFSHPNNLYLWSNHSSGYSLYYNASTDKFVFTDGTNSAVSADQAFTAGDVFFIVCSWDGSTIYLFVNGDETTDTATNTVPGPGSTFFIGSTTAGGSQSNGTNLGFSLFRRALTSTTDVVNLYNAYLPFLTNVRQINSIPYLWTTNGLGTIDNCLDSSHDNYGLILGVDGSLPARTQWLFSPSDTSGVEDYYLSKLAIPYDDPQQASATRFFYDESGTSDANACGGEYHNTGTSDPFDVTTTTTYIGNIDYDLNFFVRLAQNTGSSLPVLAAYHYGIGINEGSDAATDERTITMQSTYRLFFLGTLRVRIPKTIPFYERRLTVYYRFAPDGSNTGKIDYVMFMPGSMIKVTQVTAASLGRIRISENEDDAYQYDSGQSYAGYPVTITGDPAKLNLEPHMKNLIMYHAGDDNADDDKTDYADFDYVYVTPRWLLT